MRKYSMKSMKRNLWLGRFYIKQLATHMHWFEDKSGGLMYAHILMCDKKTGITHSKWYDGLDMEWKFWWDFNDFIIKDCKVWEEEPGPYENRIDFRKVK